MFFFQHNSAHFVHALRLFKSQDPTVILLGKSSRPYVYSLTYIYSKLQSKEVKWNKVCPFRNDFFPLYCDITPRLSYRLIGQKIQRYIIQLGQCVSYRNMYVISMSMAKISQQKKLNSRLISNLTILELFFRSILHSLETKCLN